MKTLQLNLANKLLILNHENKEDMDASWDHTSAFGKQTRMLSGSLIKPLFKGTFLTEEDYRSLIADEKGSVSIRKHPKAYLVSYNRHENAFKYLIEKEGFYWLENPLGEYRCSSGYNGKLKNSCIDSCQGSCWDIDSDEWNEAESRTLRFPIIFEILE